MTIARAILSVPIALGMALAPIVVRAVVITFKGGKMDLSRPRDREGQVKGMSLGMQQLADRLLSSHNNQLETLGYYAAGVAVAVAVKVPVERLNLITGYFLKCRFAYNLIYAAPQVANGALRTIAFLGAMISCGMLYTTAADTAMKTY